MTAREYLCFVFFVAMITFVVGARIWEARGERKDQQRADDIEDWGDKP